MMSYVARRLLALIPVWLLVSVASFAIMHIAPGDPVAAMLGPEASADGIETMRALLGLDKPLWEQFTTWLGRVLRGDLGDSIFLDMPVAEAIRDRLPVTLWLTFFALFVALLIGIPCGVLASVNRGGPLELVVMSISLIGLSIPEFLLGLGLMYVFSVSAGLLPLSGFVSPAVNAAEGFRHLVMPGVTLGMMQAALIARMTRSSMLESLDADFVRTARSKGLGEWDVVMRHGFRNALIPVITVVGMALSALLSGAFVTESVFNLPGVGNLIIMAVKRRDYPVIQGGMLFLSTMIMLVNLITDIIYVYLDPRIKYE